MVELFCYCVQVSTSATLGWGYRLGATPTFTVSADIEGGTGPTV